jgi:hypothetical protein
MPVPTEEEILAMRDVAFPHLKEEGVKRRIQLWGPIPRLVLVNTEPGEQMQLFWEETKAVALKDLIVLVRSRVNDSYDAVEEIV